jgi:DNA polymerase III subunit gamma/tau
MTTQALYNRWRGQTFGDVLGQDHITTTLQNQIKAGRIGHAYLFTGLRGTGKTSTARIMAKAVNCVGKTTEPPCNQCPICRSITEGRSLDLIEIDAASNRGIDEIRDLREKVAFSPSEARYKVYVIDEVHMLTNEAFNALLKTLEEPPSHVIFILCTTEPHRLPDTILSRCQRFDFRRGALPILVAKLQKICAQERIRIAPDALEFIARRAAGSFRDAESLLDQLAAYSADEITLDQVQSILGTVSAALVAELVADLVAGDVPGGLHVLNQAIDQGAEPHQFLTEILDHLRALMYLKVGSENDLYALSEQELGALRQMAADESFRLDRLVRAIKLFNDAGHGLRTAARPQLPLELAFVEAALQLGAGGVPAESSGTASAAPAAADAPSRDSKAQRPVEPRPRTAPAAAPGAPGRSSGEVPSQNAAPGAGAYPQGGAPPEKAVAEAPSVAEPSVEDAVSSEPPTANIKLTLPWVQGKWRQVLTRMKAIDPMLQAILNSTRPIEVHDATITLACEASFHRDRLAEDRRREAVERVLAEVLEAPYHIKCVLDTAPREAGARGEEPGSAPSDLFNAAEERESARQKLLSHPAVKELQKRGGQIAKVSLAEEDKQEGERGK